MPMPWTSEVNGGFCRNTTTAWMPMNVLINSSINVDKRIDMVQRIQELTSFRRHNLTPDPGEKRGNYLFHYINDGQIVMERYFERKKRKRPEEKEDEEDIDDDAASSSHSPSPSHSPSSSHSSSPSSSPSSSSNKKKRSATSFSSESDNAKKLEDGDQESKNRDEGIQQEVKEGQESDPQQEEQIISEGKNLLKPFFTSLRASAEGTSGRKREGSQVTSSTSVTRQTTTSIHEVRAEALKRGRGSFSLSRSRFVLFANLGHTPRVKDLRDKFHLGSIKVTSNPKRIRDFLYFRSLKLDPGEAIIAQVE